MREKGSWGRRQKGTHSERLRAFPKENSEAPTRITELDPCTKRGVRTRCAAAKQTEAGPNQVGTRTQNWTVMHMWAEVTMADGWGLGTTERSTRKNW